MDNRGGARSRSGPLADPNSLRSASKGDAAWTTLPAEGRTTPAPEWPLTEANPREMVIWTRWWKTPEALIWEQDGSQDYVALTVRMFSEAEVEKASAENRKTVRMMMADLYLTRDAKARARIRIVPAEDPEASDAADPPAKKASARDRMKVVQGGRGT